MISSTEIKAQARTAGVPESTVERDYAQNWLLQSINALEPGLVLKGGTGIRKAYIPDYRFSDDLDFTLLEDTSLKELGDLIITAVEQSKEESGINFDKEIKVKENVNGFEGIVYFRILRAAGSPLSIKLDITKKDREIIMLDLENREINHPYSDALNEGTLVYQLEEIMAEKLRALFERTRPRDLYDLWYMIERSNIGIISEIFIEKCRFKNVKPKPSSIINRRDDFKNSWTNSLGHQLKELPDFDSTFDGVVNLVKNSIKK